MAILKVYDRDTLSWIEIPVGTLFAFATVEPPDANTLQAAAAAETLTIAAAGGMTVTGTPATNTLTLESKVGEHQVVLLAAGTPVDF